MSVNQETIIKFYSAFQKLDYITMQSCYAPNAIFSDPVFGLLDASETKSMWEMLCKNAKEFSLQYQQIELLDDEYSTCHWNCTYLFSTTGRRVNNKIKAYMRFKDGLIIEQSDVFNLYSWAQMAFGLKGLLFGWTNYMQKKIQHKAKQALQTFIENNQ